MESESSMTPEDIIENYSISNNYGSISNKTISGSTEEVAKQRYRIHQLKQKIISYKRYLKTIGIFFIYFGWLLFTIALIELLRMRADTVIIKGVNYNEEIEIPQIILFLERAICCFSSLLIVIMGRITLKKIEENGKIHAESLLNNGKVVLALRIISMFALHFLNISIVGSMLGIWIGSSATYYGEYEVSRKFVSGGFTFHRVNNGYEVSKAQELETEGMDIFYHVIKIFTSTILLWLISAIILGSIALVYIKYYNLYDELDKIGDLNCSAELGETKKLNENIKDLEK